jgi:NAD-dependent deacetylase
MNILDKYFHNRKILKKLELSNSIKKIVILTGAGISKESGIETFRDNNGLWEKYSIYEVARPEAMLETPQIFYSFQNERAKEYKNKIPNLAHKSLKELEDFFDVAIITQNIDDLHEKSSSKNILHIHGKLYKVRCNYCYKAHHYAHDIFGSLCDYCDKGRLRPDIVLFKEQPLYLNTVDRLLKEADLFIQIGTSANVYPAANFVKQTKAIKINISYDLPMNDSEFDYSFYGKATKLVPLLVNKLIDNKK